MNVDDGHILERASELVHESVDRTLVRANIILAALMLLYAYLDFYNLSSIDDLQWNDIVAIGGLAVCASMIIVDRERNLVRSTGFLTFGLGWFRTFTVMTGIQPQRLETILYISLAIIGVNLMYTGINYIKGMARGRVYTVFGMVVMILINVSTFILYMQAGHTASEVAGRFPALVGMTVLYFGAVIVLESEPIRSRDRVSIQNSKLHSIVCMYTPLSGICRDTADMLETSIVDRSSWMEVDGPGPVIREMMFEIRGECDHSYAIVQEWDGHNMLHVTVSDHVGGSLIHAHRFSYSDVRRYVDDGVERLDLYGPEGCHRFHVLTEEELTEIDPYA